MARRPRTRVMKPRGSPPVMNQGPSMITPPAIPPSYPPFDPKTSRWPKGVTGIGGTGHKDFIYGDTPAPADPVQTAVQQMPYSYKGITAQDIMDYSGEVRQLTPEQMAVADVNQDGAIDLLDAIWINQMAEGLRDPNSLEGIDQPVPQPPAPPPMMPDPVQAAVDKLPGEPGFPGQGPKFPGVPPVQIPEPVGPITMPPPPVGGGGKPPYDPPAPTMPPPQGGGGPPSASGLPNYGDWSPEDLRNWSLEELESVTTPPLPPNWQTRTQAEISASNAPYFQVQGEIRRREQLKKAIEKGPYANIPGFGEVFSLPSVSGTSRYVDASGNSIPKELTSEWGRGRHGELYIPNEYRTTPDPVQDAVDNMDWGGGRNGDMVKPPTPEDPPPGWPADKPWPPDKPIFGPGVGPMCPSPKEHIQLANNDWILAGELKVGDEVITSKEPQKVTRVQRIEGAPRCEVLFEDSDSIVSSYSHPYFVNSKGFVEVGDLKKGDIIGDLVVKDKKPFSDGPVISLSVDKAETYMLRGGTEENPVPALSHNKSPVVPKPPWPPQPPTPMGEPLPPDHPFLQSPEYLKWQEQGGMGTMDMYTASDGTQFGSGTVGKMYEKWLQQYSTPPTPVTPTTPVTTTPVTPTTPVTTTPVTPETTPVTPETTPVQGTTMEEMQKMIADMQAQMQEQAAARAAQEAQMSKNYMISDERIGYNPYLSGQYQPDPYGPGGVPDMGGITTIPVPQPLTGIGYANYNPRRKI